VNYNSIPTSFRLLVFPKILRIATRRPGSNQVIGPYAIRRLFQPDPIRIVGARDYVPGDPYRYIDWRVMGPSRQLDGAPDRAKHKPGRGSRDRFHRSVARKILLRDG
jgi:hypothetical protein